MKKRIAEGFIVSFLLVLSLFFASCSHISVQAEDLIEHPSPTSLMNRVSEAIAEYCGENADLVYPSDGKNINPILFKDLNNDGVDEVVVLFRNPEFTPNNSELVNIKIFSDDGENFIPMFDIQGGWYDIGKIEISDIDGNGVSELIVGYQNLDIDRRLSVYSFDFESKVCTKMRDDQYTDWTIADINNDGIDDVVLIYSNDIQNSSLAIAYKPGCSADENPLDYTALGLGGDFYKMTVAKDTLGNNYIIVSSKYGTLLSATEILSWDPLKMSMDNISYSLSKTRNPFSTSDKANDNTDPQNEGDTVSISELIQSPVKNLFYNFCSYGRYVPEDVDGDGLVEFPMCYEFDEAYLQYTLSIGKEKRKYRYNWYRYETDSERFATSNVYRSDYNDYVFLINDSWNFDNVFIESNSELCNFYYMKDDLKHDISGHSEKATLLFRIRKSTAEIEASDGTIPLTAYKGLYYYIEINPDLSSEEKAIIPPVKELQKAFVCEYYPKLINTFDSYISDYHNYIFVIDENWDFDDVYAFESYNRDFVFYHISDPEYLYTENSSMKIPIFTIKTSPSKIKEDEYTVNLECVNNVCYYIEINPNLSEDIRSVIPSAEELREAFILTMISAS